MYVQQISIEIKSSLDKDLLVDSFNLLLEHYRANGQTQGKIELQYIQDNKIVSLPFTIDADSLDTQYNNSYVNEQIAKVEDLCQNTLQFTTVGKTHESYEGGCTCTKPDFYILITDYVSIDSPLTCVTCQRRVPLYKLPAYYDDGYMPVLRWQSNYIACDQLQMNSEVGERWALNQIQNAQSQLSKQGIAICRKIEELTQISTYYYLYNYRKQNIKSSNCPLCNNIWQIAQSAHETYGLKCDPCRLLSHQSFNS